ncbi:vWA domain-containing protein [Melittangium boletus]|uniref:VWFA domain-containing protein n=1 Tax=Melittangium boletus DSM 14713 TaxID=1294270 RepID=A0A250IPK4_9BACT|nr:vWA domain-containing protein [Melittangium boletus]ATB33198.1 hypothetical protein MEBOL_006687 [Melittangium boletus DSM 14713]
MTDTSKSSSDALDLVFWDPSGYRWNGSGDWKQWRYIPDGLGGEIGIRFGVSSGFSTFNWSIRGVAPHGSINDGTGVASFGKNEQTGLTATHVNAIRMQTPTRFTDAQNNFTVELDFSRYKGSKVGGKDGVAGANTFMGVSDIYAGQTYARTVVTITGTLADGSAASPQGWKLLNGGVAPYSAGKLHSAQLGLTNGVLQGTSTVAPGGQAKSVNTVMGLVRLDAAGCKTLRLRYDLFPVGNNQAARTDNSALYVASVFPREPAGAERPKAEKPSTPATPTVVIRDKPGTISSYAYTVRNPDGSIAGKGCFTYELPADGGEPKLIAFHYHDKLVGTIDKSHVQTFYFNQDKGDERFTFVTGTPAKGICGLTADTSLPTQLTGLGGKGSHYYLGKTLDFPELATGASVTEESTTIPAVDLVVVIDSSVSMKDKADALNQAVGAAIEVAKSRCPSDLRVTYLGIEGTFKNTRFDTTVKNYLVGTAKADEASLRSRKKGSVAGGGAQEDGARAIEDVVAHYDWRPGARRAIFFLGDEAFEGGGNVDQEDIDATNRAIEAAKKGDVRVHTYLGTSSAKGKHRKALEDEFARAASETGGKAFTDKDSLNGFQELLEKVICGSKSSTTTTTGFCCQEYVEKDVAGDH